MISKRQRIIDAVVARMQTILVINGYQTDIGKTVTDWETNFEDEDLPAVAVCDLLAEEAEESSDDFATFYKLPVQLRILSASGARAADTRRAVADLMTAVGRDRRWTVDGVPLAYRTDYARDGFLLPDGSFDIAGGCLEINIYFVTETFNPYA